MAALRVLLSLSLSAGKELSRRQLDIKGAFLNAELDEELYIQLPGRAVQAEKSSIWSETGSQGHEI